MNEWKIKLKKKYPYVYSVIPDTIWVWVYYNLIEKEL